MAVKRHVSVELTDDLDGSKATETVRFAVEGKSYEIDLSKKNSAALGKAIAPYIDAARKTSTRTAQRGAPRNVELAAVRAWAAENGIAVASRGRIPTAVLEQYSSR